MSEDTSATPTSVTFHYEKAALHRVVHVDGAFGGWNPNRHFHMALYSERFPIPKRLTHEVLPNGVLGSEISRDVRDGVFREIEVSVIMSQDTLLSMYQWLGSQLERLGSPQSAAVEPEPQGEPS